MNGSVTTFTYNNADELLSQQRPGSKAVTYTIDATANLRTIRAEGAQAVTLNVNYESFLVTMQDGPTRVTFTYDSNGNMTVEKRGGLRTTCSTRWEKVETATDPLGGARRMVRAMGPRGPSPVFAAQRSEGTPSISQTHRGHSGIDRGAVT